MLCLSRKLGEQIVIGNDIVVTVVKLYPNRVVLGFTAPDSLRVDRKEVHDIRSLSEPKQD